MGVDEAGDDDVAGRIDDPSAIIGQVLADVGDLVAFDQHVGVRHFTEFGVLGQHDPAADEDSVSHRFGPFLSPARPCELSGRTYRLQCGEAVFAPFHDRTYTHG